MEQKVFFMHIAKTAGSYVNELFLQELGSKRALVQAGAKLKGYEALEKLVREDGYKFISGHIYAHLWRELSKDMWPEFKRIAVVRDPIDHIASHILWLDHYNLPEKKLEYSRLGEPYRRLVDLISALNFDDPGQMDHFITHLPALGVQMFDNCQSRYFLAGPGRPLLNHEPITLAHAQVISREVATFDLILTQDSLDHGIKQLNEMLGIELKPLSKRVNEAKSPRTINTSNPAIKRILSKRITTDLWLWQHIKSTQAR